MTLTELIYSDLEKRRLFYLNSNEEELRQLYSEINSFEDVREAKLIKKELGLLINLLYKPIKIKST